MKLGTVIVLDRVSKPLYFGFEGSRVWGIESLACVFRDCRRTHDEGPLYLSTPDPECDVIQSNCAFPVGVDLHLRRVRILVYLLNPDYSP